jgi:hypothetical protein
MVARPATTSFVIVFLAASVIRVAARTPIPGKAWNTLQNATKREPLERALSVLREKRKKIQFLF